MRHKRSIIFFCSCSKQKTYRLIFDGWPTSPHLIDLCDICVSRLNSLSHPRKKSNNLEIQCMIVDIQKRDQITLDLRQFTLNLTLLQAKNKNPIIQWQIHQNQKYPGVISEPQNFRLTCVEKAYKLLKMTYFCFEFLSSLLL